MLKILVLSSISFFAVALSACGGAPASNANSNANANANMAIKLDNANLPEGLDPNPIQPSANTTPGIPANVTILPKGATPTPGIPSPAELKKGMKPGVTPTPGIPSAAEIQKMMKQQNPNAVNAPPPPSSSDIPMMKNTRRLQNINKPQ